MNDVVYVGKHLLTYSVTKHLHQTWELVYCTSGSGKFVFSDQVLPYSEGSITIIPPMIPHSNLGDEGFTNIHVTMKDCTLNIDHPVVINCPDNKYVCDAFCALYYYYSINQSVSASLIPIYSQLIITMIETLEKGQKKYSDIIQQITDSILNNYSDPNYDLNEALETLPFSTEYLKRIFKNEVGVTPKQFLTQKRLENAAKNLAISGDGMNISQIARQSGFSDPLYFSKLFKSRYGVSPKNYRSDTTYEAADSDSSKVFL
ncbi:MAG: AraC family transcriptional regulator [Solobacterium sp.]|nr:AraC family transcriptional regulator [Solobacterium sp.]